MYNALDMYLLSHVHSNTVFLDCRALASIIPGRERPEETTICCKISLVQLITNLNVILYLSYMPHIVHKCTNTLYDNAIINY